MKMEYPYYQVHLEQFRRLEALLGLSSKIGLEIGARAQALLASPPSGHLTRMKEVHSNLLSLTLNILACAEKSARAIRHLSAAGYGEASMSIVRTISECLLQFVYLNRNPEDHFADWRDFVKVENLRFLHLRDKHPDSLAFGTLEVAEARYELERWWRANYTRYLPERKTQTAAKKGELPRPASVWIKPTWYEVAHYADLEYEYDRDFEFASKYVHPGPRTHASFAFIAPDTGLPTADPLPSDRTVETSLTFAEESFSSFLRAVNTYLDLGFGGQVDAVMSRS